MLPGSKKIRIREYVTAAAILLLAAAGLLAHRAITKGKCETQRVVDEETENDAHSGSVGYYNVTYAKYPEIANLTELLKIREEIITLSDSGLGAEEQAVQRIGLLKEYKACRERVKSELERIRPDSAGEEYSATLDSFTKKVTERILTDNDTKNIVYSPANFYMALCMLAETVGSESRDELLSLIGVGNTEDIRKLANSIWRALYNDSDNEKCLLANSLWINERFPFNEAAAGDLASWYYTDVYTASMGEEATDAALKEWINLRTGRLLQNTAEQFQTSAETAFLLVSAIEYSDNWKNGFIKANGDKGVFITASGNSVETEFMRSVQTGSYYREENLYTLAALPMTSGASMIILLPDDDMTLQELIRQGMITEGLLRWGDAELFSTAAIHWNVPKFNVESDLSMIDTLKDLGVRRVFEPFADFSPLTGLENDADLFVSRIHHSGRVSIDEDGCAAVGFSMIEITDTGYPTETDGILEMDLNRPFAFMITGVDGLPLFIGVVNEV